MIRSLLTFLSRWCKSHHHQIMQIPPFYRNILPNDLFQIVWDYACPYVDLGKILVFHRIFFRSNLYEATDQTFYSVQHISYCTQKATWVYQCLALKRTRGTMIQELHDPGIGSSFNILTYVNPQYPLQPTDQTLCVAMDSSEYTFYSETETYTGIVPCAMRF